MLSTQDFTPDDSLPALKLAAKLSSFTSTGTMDAWDFFSVSLVVPLLAAQFDKSTTAIVSPSPVPLAPSCVRRPLEADQVLSAHFDPDNVSPSSLLVTVEELELTKLNPFLPAFDALPSFFFFSVPSPSPSSSDPLVL